MSVDSEPFEELTSISCLEACEEFWACVDKCGTGECVSRCLRRLRERGCHHRDCL